MNMHVLNNNNATKEVLFCKEDCDSKLNWGLSFSYRLLEVAKRLKTSLSMDIQF